MRKLAFVFSVLPFLSLSESLPVEVDSDWNLSYSNAELVVYTRTPEVSALSMPSHAVDDSEMLYTNGWVVVTTPDVKAMQRITDDTEVGELYIPMFSGGHLHDVNVKTKAKEAILDLSTNETKTTEQP